MMWKSFFFSENSTFSKFLKSMSNNRKGGMFAYQISAPKPKNVQGSNTHFFIRWNSLPTNVAKSWYKVQLSFLSFIKNQSEKIPQTLFDNTYGTQYSIRIKNFWKKNYWRKPLARGKQREKIECKFSDLDKNQYHVCWGEKNQNERDRSM